MFQSNKKDQISPMIQQYLVGRQGRIQTGSKGSHNPVKQFRFLKKVFKLIIKYLIIQNSTFSCKLRKFVKKLNNSLFHPLTLPISTGSLAYIFLAFSLSRRNIISCDLYFSLPGWRTRLNSPPEPFCFCEFDFLQLNLSPNRSLIDVEPLTNCHFRYP